MITPEFLKDNYPGIWNEVFDGMYTSCSGMGLNEESKKSLAHNAAFLACEMYHRDTEKVEDEQ